MPATESDDESTRVDWEYIESVCGHRTEPDDRIDIEVKGLRQHTDALLNQADWIARMTGITHDEIATAHAQGMTYQEYMAALQGPDNVQPSH